jgi:acyl dehydratase
LDLDVLARLDFPIVRYEVSRAKIAEYVAAIGDANPLHNDPLSAQEAGYRDIVAPPTFAAVFSSTPFRRALADPEWVARSTIDPSRILHGEQRYEFTRPVMPGDRLLVQCIVSEVVEKERFVLLRMAQCVDDEHGERVLDGTMTLVLRT